MEEKTRWELGCFDSFESPFLTELHEIRKKQAEETRNMSKKEVVGYIKRQAKALSYVHRKIPCPK